MSKMLVTLVALMSLSLGAAVAQDNNGQTTTPPATGGSAAPSGGGNWKQSHPVRAADNAEMRQDVKNGTLTRGQAARDRRMERRMASHDKGGHLTGAQQKRLQNRMNRQQARDARRK